MSTFLLRPVALEDVEAICAIHNRSDAFDGIPRVMEVDELREEFEEDGIDLATDSRVALVDDAVVAYVYTYHLPSDEGQERCYVFGTVDPPFRNRGIGRELLAWGVARATEQLRSSGNDVAKYVRTDAHEHVTSALHLFERAGLTPVRWFEELNRPLADLLAVRTPDGVRIEPWGEGRDEEIRQVKNAAFADHWGSTPEPAERWHQHVRGFGARPDLSFVAVDEATGAVVGHCLNHRYESDDAVLGRKDGWIDNLGTVPAWRGRGLASALIARSLQAFADEGLTHASIAVDADSPTGASRLYRSLGFEPQRRSVTYQIEVN